MKKNILFKIKSPYLHKIVIVLLSIFLSIGIPNPIIANANHISLHKKIEQQRVTISVRNTELKQILEQIFEQTKIQFGFAEGVEIDNAKYNLDIDNASVKEALNKLFSQTNYTYTIEGNKILVLGKKNELPTNSTQTEKRIIIKGKVVDSDKKALSGVTIIVKGTTKGAITDGDGAFSFDANVGDVLEVTFVGMKTLERVVTANDQNITITLEADETKIDDVIVTSFFERKTNSFTGAATVMKGDDLRRISTSNLFQALAVLDPSIDIQVSNEQGSNPNHIPDIIIRGTTSLNTTGEVGVNTPLIVIDGIESSLAALYDMDIFDIESVITLKDASATAQYGERAANGVILVTRKLERNVKLRLSYNMSGTVEMPDLTEYDLMNAQQKLQFELQSGLYDDPTGEAYKEYVERMNKANAGIDTDWMAKPLRTSFIQNHNINLTGSGSGLDYTLSARYGHTTGVMKGDSRSNAGFGVNLRYNYKGKFMASVNMNYTFTDVLNSPYGSFSDYVNANPYDAPYDENGELIKELSHNKENPLYEATLASFSNSFTDNLTASLNLRWNIRPGFYISGIGSLSQMNSGSDSYTSPESQIYASQPDPMLRGYYNLSRSSSFNYNFRLNANYNYAFDDEGTLLTLNAGGEASRNSSIPYSFSTVGFFNDALTEPSFGLAYPDTKSGGSNSSESSSVGLVTGANFIVKNRYFVDASYRLSGSSSFGKNNRYTPFWAVGIGWNVHKESWFEDSEIVNLLRLRASYGHTGSLNFAPYQAVTTYRYAQDLIVPFAMGANPITRGNDELEAQITKNTNIGITSTILDNKIDFNFDVYSNVTHGMIVPLYLPLSSGISTVSVNLGKQKNEGFDFSVSTVLLRRDDLLWRVSLNGAHNKNTLLEIGEALKRQSALSGGSGKIYIEGESQSALYYVRSAGIDPATGDEIYIKKDGTYTFDYDANDRVNVGNSEEWLRGSLSSYLNYKGFNISLNMQYSRGGDIFNSTRRSKIEAVGATNNGDVRAFTERWQQPGDIAEYKAIGSSSSAMTSRFIETENYLNITNLSVGYQFPREMIQKFGFRTLYCSLSTSDLLYLSTVKRERGTYYPFARGFSFNINVSF